MSTSGSDLPPPPPPGKIRLVRCPKCRGILPESPNVPLYKCGGCGATLRASAKKIRKEEAGEINTTSGTKLGCDPETDQNKTNELEPSYSSQANNKLISTSNDVNSSDQLIKPEIIDKEGYEISTNIISKDISSPDDKLQHKKEDSSEAEGITEEEPAEEVNNCIIYGFSSPENQLGSAHRKSDESLPSKTHNSSTNEQLEIPQKITPRDSTSSRDEMETSVVTTEEKNKQDLEEDKSNGTMLNNDENNMMEEEEEKLSGRSFHAYDGSVSSYEGWDEQEPNQLMHVLKETLFGSPMLSDNFDTNSEPSTPVSNKMKTNTQHLVRSSNYGQVMADKNVNRDQDGLMQESTRYGMDEEVQQNLDGFHPVRHSMQSEGVSGKNFYGKGPFSDNEKGGTSSSYRDKKFMHSLPLHSPEKVQFVEQNEMELLRKVDELRDQLCKSYTQRLKTTIGKFPIRGTQQENERPMYYNHELPRQEDPWCRDRSHPWHHSGTNRPSKSMPFQCGATQIPKATGCRHYADDTCLNCFPEQWRSSQQRPPIANDCYNKQVCGIHPGYMCYHPGDSGTVNPVRHINLTRVYNSQPLPRDQRHIDHNVEKLYLHRDRRNHIKRHCLPIAGGAPFIMCNRCRKLLQLPADFTISGNRCKKLRCGSCNKIHIFQLHSRNNASFRPNPPTVPPPSEVGNGSDSTRILDSVQNSDDFYKDFEVVSILEENQNRDESSIEDPSQSVSPPLTEAKLEKRLPVNRVSRSTGSPLHRLMGYTSPTEMIQGPRTNLDR